MSTISSISPALVVKQKLTDFNGYVGVIDALKLTNPFTDCAWKTFIGGITTFLTTIVILIIFLVSFSFFSDGNIKGGLYTIVIGIILNSFLIFTNAYLRKKCEAVNLLNELKNYSIV
jgi:Na+/proline symporter